MKKKKNIKKKWLILALVRSQTVLRIRIVCYVLRVQVFFVNGYATCVWSISLNSSSFQTDLQLSNVRCMLNLQFHCCVWGAADIRTDKLTPGRPWLPNAAENTSKIEYKLCRRLDLRGRAKIIQASNVSASTSGHGTTTYALYAL